tara:strand:- start:53 stop:1210 length:1158 start_codon:yes stop_codon:yes gene_type:complete
MKHFSTFLDEAKRGGSKKPSGAEFENIICVAYNMKSQGVDKEQAIKLADTTWKPEKFDDWLDIGHKIVKNSFGSNPKGIMKHFGSGMNDLTPEWEKYFIDTTGKKANASTKTPKTDMYIGNQHISLKKYGGSQLMSGGQAETLATLAFAYDAVSPKVKTKALDEAWNTLIADIEKDFVTFKLPPGGRITNYKQAIKSGVKDDMTNFVADKLQKQKVMTKALQEILKSPEVNLEVVREAMTGNNKFKDKLAIATHIMKFDESGNADYIKIDDAYTKKVASQTSFNISFKTSGTGGTAWTATKGIFSESIMNESYDQSMIQMLDEGLFDKVYKKSKQGFNFLKLGLRKMLKFIWNKIKILVTRKFSMALKYFGVKMSVKNGDPKVKF